MHVRVSPSLIEVQVDVGRRAVSGKRSIAGSERGQLADPPLFATLPKQPPAERIGFSGA
jgi:hypothetical protein